MSIVLSWSAIHAKFNRSLNLTFKVIAVPCMSGKVDSSFCIWLFIMSRVSNVQKARAIGQIEAGMLQKDVAERLDVSPGTITKWKQTCQATGDVKDRPRSVRPKTTTEQQDRYIRVLALQDRRRTSQSIQRSAVRRYNTRL